jgi:hypothetical protein
MLTQKWSQLCSSQFVKRLNFVKWQNVRQSQGARVLYSSAGHAAQQQRLRQQQQHQHALQLLAAAAGGRSVALQPANGVRLDAAGGSSSSSGGGMMAVVRQRAIAVPSAEQQAAEAEETEASNQDKDVGQADVVDTFTDYERVSTCVFFATFYHSPEFFHLLATL